MDNQKTIKVKAVLTQDQFDLLMHIAKVLGVDKAGALNRCISISGQVIADAVKFLKEQKEEDKTDDGQPLQGED